MIFLPSDSRERKKKRRKVRPSPPPKGKKKKTKEFKRRKRGKGVKNRGPANRCTQTGKEGRKDALIFSHEKRGSKRKPE